MQLELVATVSELREDLEVKLITAMSKAKDTPEHAAVGAVVEAWVAFDRAMREGDELPSAWI